MTFALLVDVGSTFTKARAVDLDTGTLVALAQAPTTAATDVLEGVHDAVRALGSGHGFDHAAFVAACSSAAGGLRIVAIGLVPDLTVAAAREAALGAGARLVGVHAGQLTTADVEAVRQLAPDLVLLAGGTDGGEQATVVANAVALAAGGCTGEVLFCGNRAAAEEVVAVLAGASVPVTVTENVLPDLGAMNVEPARAAIRELFLRSIVDARGLGGLVALLDADLVPTPLAVLQGAALVSRGVASHGGGLGDVLVVDVGGATTDVHSIADGRPRRSGVVWKGVPEPTEKRTVEGDLGLRVNATGIVEALHRDHALAAHVDDDADGATAGWADTAARDVTVLPTDDQARRADHGLAAVAVDVAVGRHVGRLTRHYGLDGEVLVQRGKDLTEVTTVIGTGGVFAHAGPAGAGILAAATARPERIDELRPARPRLLVDRRYLLAAAGLLAPAHAEVAQRLALDHLDVAEREGDAA